MSQIESTEKLLKYRIYCGTEQSFQYSWRTEAQGPPTVCPNDATHIVATPIDVVGWIDPTKIVIKEEEQETGGNYLTKTLSLTATANQTSSATVTYPYPVSVLAVSFASEETHRGDTFDLIVGKDTPIGTLTADASLPTTFNGANTYQPGDNVEHSSSYYTCTATTSETPSLTATFWDQGFSLPVSSTVSDNTAVGFHVKVGSDDLNSVLVVGEDSIVVETPPSSGLSSGDVVLQSVYKIQDYKIGKPRDHVFGTSKIGASYVPANTEITVEYNNTSPSTDKEFIGVVEYLH